MGRDNTGNKKLKIAMLGHKRVPSREGGIEIVVEELASRMVAEGHSVTCYNRRGHHVSGAEFDGKQLSEYKGIKIKTVPTINRKGLAAMTSSFFAAVKTAFGHYDIIHIHAEGPAAMCWIPKLCGKMVVVTIHGDRVILGTKIKRLQRATYLERNANIRQCCTGSLRLSDEIDF